MNILVFGAGSRIAHECARLWIAQGHALVLCGRSSGKLDAVAADLRVTGGPSSSVTTIAMPEDEGAMRAAIAEADRTHGPLELVLVAHGWLPQQADAERDAGVLRQAVHVNAILTAQICEAIAPAMAARRKGTIAVIGSVAGDRGRQSNYVYGAAKGFVERYCQGLRNRLHPLGVRVLLVKPGPTATPMTRDLPDAAGLQRLADPADVARDIVRAAVGGKHVIYTPARWRWIMAVIRLLPESLFVRLKL